MKKLLLIIAMAFSTMAFSQKFSVTGQLVDTLSNPLPSPTVLLLNPKDSSLVNFVVGDVNGRFTLKNVGKGEHLLKVSFMGFRHFTRKVTTPELPQVIDLGSIKMFPASNELEAIEIRAERAPVVVKKDTIEFNAGAFKTKQNAVVEDLLKKLPGVEVDNDGNITAQGEQVRNVTVDGRKFFGSDPKLATKNLPADAIDKVQVFDKKSDQATFSGIDDGSREKTINLALKEEKRNGAFGNVMGGVGTESRYQGRASINRFTKSRQLSFLGMGNNINEQGFSMDDYMNFTGGSQQMMGGGGAVRMTFSSDNANGVPLNFGSRANGIMGTLAGGINLNNQFSRKTDLNGSYFFNYIDHQRTQSTYRENFLPAPGGGMINAFNTDQNNNTHNTNSNHRINLTLDHKLDSVNALKLTTAFTYNETDSESRGVNQTLNSDNALLNEAQTLSLSSGTNTAMNSSLLWRHRFAKKGRNFSANLQFNYGENIRNNFLQAATSVFGPQAADSTVMQTSDQSTLNTMYSGTFSYTEPLGGRKYLEANYTYRQNLNDVERHVNDVSGDVPVYDENLSNLYNSDYQYHRGGLNFRMNRTNYNFTVGGSIQQTYLKGYLELRDVQISRAYQNLLPTFRFNYDFSTSKHLNLDYETSVQEPSIQELQPVIDYTSLPNIYEGNPDLRPAYNQSWRLNFNTFNPVNFMSFFAFVDVDYITNAITNSRTINPQFGSSVTKPVNVDNNMNVTGNATIGFPVNKIKSRFSIGANVRNRRSINLINETANTINQQTAGGDIRYAYHFKEIFDLSLTARIERQLTDYEFGQEDQIFLNNNYTAEGNLSFLKNYQFSSKFEFLQYENQSNNFKQNIPLLNLSVSRFILKNKVGELKFAVNNLLDKALGVSQTANLNYIERQTTNSLGRIFMVSFTYAINKQLNPMGMRRGGNMIRMIR